MKSIKQFVITTILCLSIIAIPTIVIDPFFHFHKPLTCLSYELDDERYQNYGIAKNWDYDAIITGTSMAENFKNSELDSFLKVHSTKLTFSGSSYKEINDCLKKAYSSKNTIKLILRSFDPYYLITDKNGMRMDANNLPLYLYNNNPFDDIEYLFNFDVLLKDYKTILYTKSGEATTDFDTYASWSKYFNYGKDEVLKSYVRPEQVSYIEILSQSDVLNVKDNVMANIVELAVQHPETEYILFIPPYSICYWDNLIRNGKLERELEAELLAVRTVLINSNIKIYGFSDCFQITTNLNNYKDYEHYKDNINTYILTSIIESKHQITLENSISYYENVRNFYSEYDYDRLFN